MAVSEHFVASLAELVFSQARESTSALARDRLPSLTISPIAVSLGKDLEMFAK